MEIAIVIGLILAAGVALLYTKFANFKSKLMNELGRRGLAFDQADMLYTIYRDKVHDMHNNGCSIDIIVDSIISNRDLRQERASNHSTPLPQSRTQRPTEKEKNVIELVVETIAMQLMLSPHQVIDATDDFAVGYLIGYADAAMQKAGIDNNSPGGLLVLKSICDHFLGEDFGSAAVGKFVHNQMNLPKSFGDGLMAGGQDVFDWIGTSQKVIPSSLAGYYSDKRR